MSADLPAILLQRESRVLLLAPNGHAALATRLARRGVSLHRCRSLRSLARVLPLGAAAVVVTLDAFDRRQQRRLKAQYTRLPADARPPLVLLGRGARPVAAEMSALCSATGLADSAPGLDAAVALITALRQHGHVEALLRGEMRRQARALRESEERLRVILKHSPLVVTHVNRALRYEWIHNPHPEFSVARIVGRRVEEVGPRGSGAEVARLKQQVLDTGEGVRAEVHFPEADGNHYYDVVIEPMREDGGEIVGVTSAALDITERKRREMRLRESEERLELAISGSSSGFWDIALDPANPLELPDEVYLSPRQKMLIGYYDHDFPNSLRRWQSRIVHEDLRRLRQALADHLAGRRPGFEAEYRIYHRDGRLRWVSTRGTVIRDEHDRPVRWIGLDWDITERKEAEEERARLAAIVQSSSDAIIGITLEGQITSWNTAAQQMYGYTEAEVLGRSLALLIPDSHAADLVHVLQRLRQGERIEHLDSERLRKDGSRCHVSVTLSPVHDADGRVVFASAIERDITERKQLQEQLYREAFHDSLTGLPNRALFLDRLQHAIDRARRQQAYYAVLIIDLDNFKVVNDSLGHLHGDELLVKVSRRIAECLRPADTLSRFGGDEFTVLLEGMDGPADVQQVVRRIQEKLTHTFDLRGHQVQTGASIGIALGDKAYLGPDAALRDADTALYQAKARGKNCHVIFDEPMRALAVARLRLETLLREAIAEGKLAVHYQPIVCLKTRRIVGCEALARWDDPSLGAIAPTEFIPIAEECGLIVPLGQQVLETALRDLAGWLAAGAADPHFYVSVNLSTRQFSHGNLCEQVLEALRVHDLRGAHLRLEITESVMMNHDAHAAEMLAELRAAGVQICMDDFGTGYSSLSYLQRFPVDVLKIDKSFVQGIHSESITREIVRTVVRLAHGLNSEAIAEGVENEEHLKQLTALGFRRGQGFLFHQAVDSEEMATLLREPARPTHPPKPAGRASWAYSPGSSSASSPASSPKSSCPAGIPAASS